MKSSTYSEALSLMDKELRGGEGGRGSEGVEGEGLLSEASRQARERWLKAPETQEFLIFLASHASNLVSLAKQGSAMCINGEVAPSYVLPYIFEAQILDKVLNYAKNNKYE
jgi:hypothetical protein